MVAYPETDLKNLTLQQFAGKALASELITKEEYNNILLQHPVRFYSPNVFLRIGSGLLVSIVSSAIIGLLLLLSDAKEPAPLLLLMGFASIAALETSIRKWHHYRSGIDDVLLHSGILYILFFFSMEFNFAQEILLSAIAFFLYLFASLRYLDRLAAVLATGALISGVYHIGIQWGQQPNARVLFIIAATMALAAWVIDLIQKKAFFPLQHQVLQLAKYTAIIACYGSLHYYIVEHYLSGYNNLAFPSKIPVYLDWFYWIWTILMPIAFLYYGLAKKLHAWIRIGIALIIAFFFFWQYEFHPMDHDIAALFYGILLVVIAWIIITYLKTSNSEFTDEVDPGSNDGNWAEFLAISAGFSGQASSGANNSGTGTDFGGGNFGGGGAGSQF